MGEVLWVLDHQADLDADFLAVYGIDLDTYPMRGDRYMALAYRLPAYQGVMAGRQAAEKEQREAAPEAPSAPQQRTQAAGTREVSLTAFRAQFPGLVSVGSSRKEG